VPGIRHKRADRSYGDSAFIDLRDFPAAINDDPPASGVKWTITVIREFERDRRRPGDTRSGRAAAPGMAAPAGNKPNADWAGKLAA
jgi:hypothetical protein